MGRLLRTFRAERFHPGNHREHRHDRESEWRFQLSTIPAIRTQPVLRSPTPALGNFDLYSEFGAKAYTPYVANALDLFAQDSWKATPKLTVEYGVRWSLWPQWHSKWGNLSEFLPQYYNRAECAGHRSQRRIHRQRRPVQRDRATWQWGAGCGGRTSARAAYRAIQSAVSRPSGRLVAHSMEGLSAPRWASRMRSHRKWSLRVGVRHRSPIASRSIVILRSAETRRFSFRKAVVNGLVDTPGGATQRVFPFTQTIQDPVFKIPTAWEWNAHIPARDIRWGTTVEVGYVGRRGLHNQIKRNINQLLPGTMQANPGINANYLRPYVGYGVIDISENAGLPVTTVCRSASSGATLRFPVRRRLHILTFRQTTGQA